MPNTIHHQHCYPHTVKRAIITMLLSAILCITGALTGLAQGDTWVQKNDLGFNRMNVLFPTPRNGAVGFSIGNKGYLGTGFSGNGNYTTYYKDFWEYDPEADTWTQKADFGGGTRGNAVGFSIGNKGYLGTGYSGTDPMNALYYFNDFWEYNPATNTWTQKADFGGGDRSDAVGFSIGSKGYLGTGIFTRFKYKDYWEYDPALDTWTKKADVGGYARVAAVGFNIGNKGYVGTGADGNGNLMNDFWEYDPALNTWTQKKYLGGLAIYARISAVGFSNNGKGYITMGENYANAGYFKDVWEYNPENNTWTRKADCAGEGRIHGVGFSIGTRVYIGMGSSYYDSYNGYSYLSDFWAYDPTGNSWTEKAGFRGTARYNAVGFSIGSKGYIGTGLSISNDILKDFWEYDPVTDTWTQKADFGGGERHGAVGFSIGNKGYIGTGTGTSGSETKDFWEYDPTSNSWTQKANFGGSPRSYAVGFSIGSKGYIGTGEVQDFFYINSLEDFWEYDPISNSWTQKAYFGGGSRSYAVGFSIGNKGYLGTGTWRYDWSGLYDSEYNDFWEYDPAANKWTQKAPIGSLSRSFSVGFSIGEKGYLGTGRSFLYIGTAYNDLWEYDPPSNTWRKKADFEGGYRSAAVGFSIGGKGYIGTGSNTKDFWEYTPDTTCTPPINLKVPNIADTAARLTWALPAAPVSGFQVQYGAAGSGIAVKKKVQGTKSQLILKGLQPNTTYRWKIRSICATDTSDWVSGPRFTTTASAEFSSSATAIIGNNSTGTAAMQVMPNPNKGSFSVQMHLPATATTTILSLYNNLGEKIWQQHAGQLSGSVKRNIALDNTLPAGVYILMVQHGETRMMQKVVVVK